jgi:hypothetical protein
VTTSNGPCRLSDGRDENPCRTEDFHDGTEWIEAREENSGRRIRQAHTLREFPLVDGLSAVFLLVSEGNEA